MYIFYIKFIFVTESINAPEESFSLHMDD